MAATKCAAAGVSPHRATVAPPRACRYRCCRSSLRYEDDDRASASALGVGPSGPARAEAGEAIGPDRAMPAQPDRGCRSRAPGARLHRHRRHRPEPGAQQSAWCVPRLRGTRSKQDVSRRRRRRASATLVDRALTARSGVPGTRSARGLHPLTATSASTIGITGAEDDAACPRTRRPAPADRTQRRSGGSRPWRAQPLRLIPIRLTSSAAADLEHLTADGVTYSPRGSGQVPGPVTAVVVPSNARLDHGLIDFITSTACSTAPRCFARRSGWRSASAHRHHRVRGRVHSSGGLPTRRVAARRRGVRPSSQSLALIVAGVLSASTA